MSIPVITAIVVLYALMQNKKVSIIQSNKTTVRSSTMPGPQETMLHRPTVPADLIEQPAFELVGRNDFLPNCTLQDISDHFDKRAAERVACDLGYSLGIGAVVA